MNRCDGRTHQVPGEFGFLTVQCKSTRGLRTWYDAQGTIHNGCAAHVADLVRRYPEADPPEPEWLEGDVQFPVFTIGSRWLTFVDAVDAAKWEQDRSWTA